MEPYIVKDLTYYRNAYVKSCLKMPKGIIHFYELTFDLKGSLTYIVVGIESTLYENDAVLIRPEMLRERRQGNEPVNYVSFNFYVYDDAALPKEVFLKKIISQETKNILSAFPLKHMTNSYHEKEKTMNLLNYIIHDIGSIIDFESSNSHIIKIKKYINTNLDKPLTLTDISNHINLSKEYTASIFKKETNKTVTEYINEKKMLLAKEMLQAGGISLNGISESLGYENYSYFSRIFKERFGISPKKMEK